MHNKVPKEGVCAMIPSQMLKGTLEGCILKIINSEEIYGYEISQKLKEHGFHDISEGTIYPLLLRLERGEFITATFRNSNTGPKRKYFHITEKGKEELNLFIEHWEEMQCAVNHLFREGETYPELFMKQSYS